MDPDLSNPYESTPAAGGGFEVIPPDEAALRRVRERLTPPGIAQLVVGFLGFVWGLIYVAIGIAQFALQESGSDLASPELGGEDPETRAAGYALALVIFGSQALGGLVAGLAGMAMLRVRFYWVAMAGAILGAIPCITSPCCFLGVPFAIWSFVILLQPETRALYRSLSDPAESPAHAPNSSGR